MDLLSLGRQIDLLEQADELGELCRAAVFFLEHPRVLALHGVSVGIIRTVVLHRVDEEQAEHLDAQRRKPGFLHQMLVNGAADHQALQRVCVHIAHGLTGLEKCLAARQFHFEKLVVAPGADFADPAIGVNGAPGQLFQIIAILDDGLLAADLLAFQRVDLDARRDRPLAVACGDEAHIRLVVTALDFERRHLDLLDQLPLIGVHRVQPEHHVVLVHMGGRITQRAKRIHLAKSALASAGKAAIDALRLINDQDRARGTDQIDGPFSAGLLAVLVEVVDVLLVDGADGHHHDLDVRAGGEIAHLTELGGIIEEIIVGLARIEPLEMLLSDLQRFVDAFLDRDRGHHDHEFGEAIELVQLEDRPQVDVSFSGAGLHFHGEIARGQAG